MATYVRPVSPLIVLLLAISCFQGCGESDGKLEVQGTATWNGEPIKKGYVELTPEGAGQIDGADIVDGKFTLRTTEGAKKVAVSADKVIGQRPASSRYPNGETITFQYIPAEFNEASTLTATIDSSDPVLSLDLKGEERSQELTPAERARLQAQGGSEN